MRIILIISVPLIILGVALTSEYLLLERLFILAISILFFSFLIALSGIWGIKGRLAQPSRYHQAGEPFLNEAVIENTNILPKPFLGLKIITSIRHEKKRATLVSLASRTSFQWSLPMIFPTRGIYKIGPLFAQATDPFGLFQLQKKLDKEKIVLICPPTVELPFFTLSSQTESDPFRNGRAFSESGNLIAGVRDYVPGDSLSRIHWRSTAHRGKLIVKEYDSELNQNTWIFLDLSKKSVCGTGLETTEEYCICIAASILKKLGDAGQQVGLIARGSNYYYFPPRSGRLNVWRIMESMALMKADGRIPLSRLINRAFEQLDHDSIAIIITACADKEFTEAAIRVRKRGINVTAILLDSCSFGGRNALDTAVKLLRAKDISTFVVKKGANLAKALNNQQINVN